MKYIKGKNLEALCQEQPEQRFAVDPALTMMTPIVKTLIYLHQQEPPIVHRDMKPANIIVLPDEVEAILVGLATPKEDCAEVPTVALRDGSPGYAAIEQYGGANGTDLRTDVYGLGATFYTLLTGTTPIDAITRVTMEQGDDPLKPVNALVPTIPLPVTTAIERAMSLHKKDRFATVEEFWQAMHADAKEQVPHEGSSSTEGFDRVPASAASFAEGPHGERRHRPRGRRRRGTSSSIPYALRTERIVAGVRELIGYPQGAPLRQVSRGTDAGRTEAGRRQADAPTRPYAPLQAATHELQVSSNVSGREETLPLPEDAHQAAESVVADPLPVQHQEESSSTETPPFPEDAHQAAESDVVDPLPVQHQEDGLIFLTPKTLPTYQATESDVVDPSPIQPQQAPARRRNRVLSLSLALILLLGLGLSCFVYVVGPSLHAPAAHKPTTLSLTPTTVANTSLYPPLASSYAGTVSNISVPKTTTKLYLRDMQQDQNGLHGSFEGLGMVGPFTGKVTASGKVLFKVHSGTTMLIFDGVVEDSGILEGTFNGVNQHGRSIGKYGLWYASVSSTL